MRRVRVQVVVHPVRAGAQGARVDRGAGAALAQVEAHPREKAEQGESASHRDLPAIAESVGRQQRIDGAEVHRVGAPAAPAG
ncbi:hypothetical protein G6F22_018559 [Rhizopus arrhizus]|nr:hypothetical protein G6F22_018559 [Rhizopus arrhizus]